METKKTVTTQRQCISVSMRHQKYLQKSIIYNEYFCQNESAFLQDSFVPLKAKTTSLTLICQTVFTFSHNKN